MKTFFGVILALVTATCLYAKDYRMVGYIACNSLPKLDAKLISYFSKLHSPLRKIPKAMDRILWASQHPQYCSDKGVLNLARMMDLERPQGLYFMVPKSSDNGKAECVIAVKRLGSSKKDTVNLLGTKFASKCFKKMRYMSLNKDALSDMKSFEELPRIKK